MSSKKSSPKLTLGPVFFHWEAEKKRDFYFRIADEADIDVVYVGEVVCSKREPFFRPYMDEVVERLKKARKEVVLSSLAMVTTEREIEIVNEYVSAGYMVEANDVACIKAVAGKPHVVGPFITVLNEGARDYLVRNGAKRTVFPVEMTVKAMGAAIRNGVKAESEAIVFGRLPLSVSMRCYSARAYGLNKDKCKFSCGQNTEGLETDTLDGQKLLIVNGTQTMSYGYAALLREIPDMIKAGVTHFRLSPHDMDMPAVAAIYRNILEKKADADESLKKLKKHTKKIPFINGFAWGKEGIGWVE